MTKKKKPTKTREELSALIMEQLRNIPECRSVTAVVIAPVLRPDGSHPNWHAAFTMGGRRQVPRTAWRQRQLAASHSEPSMAMLTWCEPGMAWRSREK